MDALEQKESYAIHAVSLHAGMSALLLWDANIHVCTSTSQICITHLDICLCRYFICTREKRE
jgi:hypothetical protein